MVVEKIVLDPLHVIYVNDTADKIDLPRVFGKAYSELFAFAFNNRIRPLKPMAFYYSHVDPLLLEIVVEIDKMPEQLNGRIKCKTIKGGEAVVAHYTRPYEQLAIP